MAAVSAFHSQAFAWLAALQKAFRSSRAAPKQSPTIIPIKTLSLYHYLLNFKKIMMKKAIFGLLLIAGLTLQAQSYQIQLQLEKGKTYFYKNISGISVKQSVMGQNNEIKIDLNSNMSFKVIEKNKDIYTLEARHTLMETNTKAMGNTSSMSSEDKTNNPTSKIFVAIKDVPFTILINQKGNLLDVIG